ncbi:hypothetical protein EW145_g1201 [Phellinidium pouzarii]|uniref:Exocyst complex protein EXO70 n=1 Tax=Phellinidium pouzarii TaxID=167371 RepID=A0A4S4LH57_9AGAM|nr:hypothetical protein EW145_g1201 [Phellinidium pouzarii]
MEDEAAEIELLEQNLNKTRQISQRMTSILSNFDTRLVKLEKSILPLHNSTQLLFRRAANIDGTMQLINEVASSQQGLAEEEALIIRGPQATQLNVYVDALERMNASIAFKGSSGDSADSARLVETGAKKLAQLYTKFVAEASSGTPPIRSSLDDNAFVVAVPFASNIVQTLHPLVAFLRTLPLPATHPSHPAAAAIQAALTDAQRGYADMRGSWVRKCIELDAKRVVEGRGDGYASGKDTDAAALGIREGQEFAMWIEGVIDVADGEYDLLSELALLPSTPQLTSAFASLMTPVLTLLQTSLTQLTNRVKRTLHRNAFLALSAHGHLAGADVMRRWDDLVQRRAGLNTNVSALKDGMHSLRAVCLRSFPEFLADIRLAAMQSAGGELGTDIAEITVTVIKYMTAIPAIQDAVGTLLLTLGDGNWKMGEGVTVSKGPKLGEGDEATVIEHYLYDIIITTLSTLTTLSRSARRPAFGAIFLLNNVSYFLSSLLSPVETAPVEVLLAPPARNALQSGFRTAKAAYFDANFSPLLQALGDGPGSGSGSSGRAAVKEKFTRFYELLDDIVERHRVVRVLPEDNRALESLAEEAVKLVVPSLQRFIQKHKDFSKNPQKYIKTSPEEVERQIRKLYSY